MLQIFRREIKLYFGSTMAYIVIAIFLISTSLLLWVFRGYQNILDTEFANLNGLFHNAPWLFLWLIPALCMHLFSETYRNRKSVLLFTRPIKSWSIVLGKYWAAFTVILTALLPTLVYVLSISLLSDTVNSIDFGAIIGSYLGLILLSAVYISISLFTSSIANNQLIALLLGIILCAFMYSGWTYFGALFYSLNLQNTFIALSIEEHYHSISRGVIDTRDIVYFILVTVLFLLLTKLVVERKR